MPEHIAYPVQLGPDGTFATLRQDTLDDIRQCVEIIIRTPIGTRRALPRFGVPRMEFVNNIPTAAVLEAIYTWEPRAAARAAANLIPGDDPLVRDLNVTVGR